MLGETQRSKSLEKKNTSILLMERSDRFLQRSNAEMYKVVQNSGTPDLFCSITLVKVH